MKKFYNSKFLIHVVCSFGLLACGPEKSKDTPSENQQIAHRGGDKAETRDAAKNRVLDGYKKKIDVLKSQVAQQKELIGDLQNGTNTQQISLQEIETQVQALETDKATLKQEKADLKKEKDDLENEKQVLEKENHQYADSLNNSSVLVSNFVSDVITYSWPQVERSQLKNISSYRGRYGWGRVSVQNLKDYTSDLSIVSYIKNKGFPERWVVVSPAGYLTNEDDVNRRYIFSIDWKDYDNIFVKIDENNYSITSLTFFYHTGRILGERVLIKDLPDLVGANNFTKAELGFNNGDVEIEIGQAYQCGNGLGWQKSAAPNDYFPLSVQFVP